MKERRLEAELATTRRELEALEREQANVAALESVQELRRRHAAAESLRRNLDAPDGPRIEDSEIPQALPGESTPRPRPTPDRSPFGHVRRGLRSRAERAAPLVRPGVPVPHRDHHAVGTDAHRIDPNDGTPQGAGPDGTWVPVTVHRTHLDNEPRSRPK